MLVFGSVILKPEREDDLKDRKRKLKRCTQYALVATRDAFYPCYNCPNGQDSIYLFKDEIWKYGQTCEENAIQRYHGNLPAPYLRLIPQFEGTLEECKAEELQKIYHYPLLPENQKRKKEERLIRPAGNPYDA
jgi:hypothetical protein